MKRLTTFGVLCLMTASVARADSPAPPPPAPKAKLVVMVDVTARSPRLVVPKQFLSTDGKRSDAGSILPTIMSGLALALAFAGTGIWMVRQRKGGQSALLGVVACLAVLALVASLSADFAPSKPEQKAAFDGTTVYVVEKGEAIQLVISPADLEKMQAKK